MLQKEENRDDLMASASGRLVIAETMRNAANSGDAKTTAKPEKDEERMSLFWRVFGGTVLSIAALVVMTLYNNLATGISDLRTDLGKERDARAELVKKDDFNARSTAISERIRALDALKVETEGLRERITAAAASVDDVKKESGAASEGVKKDVAATVAGLKKDVGTATELVKKDEALLEVIKERVTAVEELKKDVAVVEVLKDKVASASADLKAMHDELVKLQQGAERSRTTELDHKTSHDLQVKQLEDSVKELQKGLQDCREKLARLEGAKPNPPATKP